MTITEDGDSQVLSSNRVMDLPDDVLFTLLEYCDIQMLGRLACVCRRLYHLIRQDCVWLPWKRRMTCVGLSCTDRPRHIQMIRDQCRLARNWKHQKCKDFRVVHHSSKLRPWMQLCSNQLWISYADAIRCYATSPAKPSKNKTSVSFLREIRNKYTSDGSDDIGRFVCKDRVIVSGSSDGTLSTFDTATGNLLSSYTRCHDSDIHCVDVTGDDIAISGSRDATVKIWRLHQRQSDALLHSLSAGDRVWSIAVSPDGRSFISGTSAINQMSPIRLWDLDRAQLLGSLGDQYKRGAGVLDIQFDSCSTALTCGYDTFIRLWDLRLPLSKCVAIWEEPYDSALYCVRSDGNNAFVVGTARHGMVRLWDKRKTTSVQMYFVGRHIQSPVYSLAFDSSRLFVGVDVGVHILNFN